ncbi:kelch domain-containing protein 10-like isoform X2 [Glandiceps talaboti]
MAAPMAVGELVNVQPVINPKTDVPHERSGHCCVADNGYLFAIGGIYYDPMEILLLEDDDDFDPVFNEIWCYNISLNIWCNMKMSGPIPPLTASMSSILSGNMIFTFGGSGFPFGAESDNRVHTFNRKTQTWATLPCKGDFPHAKYGQAMALVHNRYLYVYGGCRRLKNGIFVFDSDLHRVNLKTYLWEKIKDPTKEKEKEIKRKWYGSKKSKYVVEDKKDDEDEGVDSNDSDDDDDDKQEEDMYPLANGSYRHQIVNDEERLYILGGGTLWREVLPFDRIHAFNYSTNRWELLNSQRDPIHADGYPPPRKYHSCVQTENDVYITGGHNGYEVFKDIWKLSLPDLQWTRLDVDLVEPLFFHSAALTPAGCMYIFGGVCTIQNNRRSNALYRIWLYVPPLHEICWNVLVKCIPNIRYLSHEHLRQLGVPQMFTDRLDWDRSSIP